MKLDKYSSLLREKKLREITSLLREKGPMEIRGIAENLPHISANGIPRYIDALFKYGYIRKIQCRVGRKNTCAYEFRSIYGAKTDIVSMALSHPLHQVTLYLSGTGKLTISKND